MGLSEHQTGKLFHIPSVTRVLKDYRQDVLTFNTDPDSLNPARHKFLSELSESKLNEAKTVALATVAKALEEDKIDAHNLNGLQKQVRVRTMTQISSLPPQLSESLLQRIDKSSLGLKQARHLPFPEVRQR